VTASRISWGVMTVLALFIAAYAGLVLFLPGFAPPFLSEQRANVPLALYGHLAGGMLAMALGPWQFSTRLRTRALGWHRRIGRAYVIAVIVGGLGGLGLAPGSMGGLVAHLGFGMLGVLWLSATTMAWIRIRSRDQVAHRRWMIRSYALTLAAVTLRLYIPLSSAAGVPFETAYQAISWLCWVPNLIVAEWIIFRRPSVAIQPVT